MKQKLPSSQIKKNMPHIDLKRYAPQRRGEEEERISLKSDLYEIHSSLYSTIKMQTKKN